MLADTKTRFQLLADIMLGRLGISRDQITAEADILGYDSLDTIALLMAVEEEFDLDISDEKAETLKTMGDVLALLEDMLGPEFPDGDGYLGLTDNQFINRYRPEKAENGDYYRQREWSDSREVLLKAIDENRCWTMVEGDNGELVIDWGSRTVNRLYNIITARPIEDPSWLVQVADKESGELDGDPRILCDVEWDFGDMADPPMLPVRVVVALHDVNPFMEEVTEDNSGDIADYLSDKYGWAVKSFTYRTLQPGEEAEDVLSVRCAVPCSNSNGEPDFFFCRIVCNQRLYDGGAHYAAARQAAEAAGYSPGRIVFDENDPGFSHVDVAWKAVSATATID